MLFKQADFLSTENSFAFARLINHKDNYVSELASFLCDLTRKDILDVDAFVPKPPKLKYVLNKYSTPHTAGDSNLSPVASVESEQERADETAEAAGKASPRKTRYNPVCGRVSPFIKQAILMLVPHMWIQVWFFVTGIGLLLTYNMGHDVTAHITDKTATPGTSKGGSVYYTYDVSYCYTLGSRVVNNHLPVLEREYRSLKPGDPVKVRLIESLPQSCQITQLDYHEPVSFPYQAMLAFLPFGPFLVGFEIWIWAEPIKHWLLARTGGYTGGRIADKYTKRGGRGTQYYKCNYTYMVNGEQFIDAMDIGQRVWEQLKEGEERIVLYERSNPKRSCLLDFAFFKPRK